MWQAAAFTALLFALTGFALWWRERTRSRLDRAELTAALVRLERDRQERSAQEESRQHALFDEMTEGVMLVTAEFTISFVNLALKRLLGLTADVRGQPLAAILQHPPLAEFLREVLAGGQLAVLDVDLPEPINRCLQVSVSLFTSSPAGQPQALLMVHDLSRLRRFEASRRDFVANVSHELRTPLTFVKGFVETLLHGAKDDPVQLDRYLRIIDRHANRLMFLIEDLLDLARLEAGESAMNLQDEPIGEIASRVLADLAPKALERRIQLENTIPQNLHALADASRLEQVFSNLIENAIKYGREKGSVSISGRPLPNQGVEICVRDDGPGIPAANRDRVFERFYRLDAARDRERGGTGLGLAIVKHIVKSHGGEVWVQSEPGLGAAFFFTLRTV